jgi:hypothetical protein
MAEGILDRPDGAAYADLAAFRFRFRNSHGQEAACILENRASILL